MARTESETMLQGLKDFKPGATQAFYGLRTEEFREFYLSDGSRHVDPEAISLSVPGWTAFIGRSTGVVTIRAEGRKVDITVKNIEDVSLDGDWVKRSGRIVFEGRSRVELRCGGNLNTYTLTKTDGDGDITHFDIDGR